MNRLENIIIRMVPKADQVPYLKEKGYIFEKHKEIDVKASDLPPTSHKKIDVPCDICGVIRNPELRNYIKAIQKDGFYCCPNCAPKHKYNRTEEQKQNAVKKAKQTLLKRYGCDNAISISGVKEKMKQTNLERYGCENPTQNKEIRQKAKDTLFKHYGVYSPSESPIFKEKIKQTNMSKYGGTTPMASKEIREKVANTNIKKYGSKSALQNPQVIQKRNNTMYKNGTMVASAQQRYICNLLELNLNYPVGAYFLDICDNVNKIDIEYDGGGHKLAVKRNLISEDDFNIKEIIRDKQIKKNGYKIVRIVSDDDKLPSDEILISMYQSAIYYFTNTNHHWIEYNIDKSIVRNALNMEGEYYDYGPLRYIKEGDNNATR